MSGPTVSEATASQDVNAAIRDEALGIVAAEEALDGIKDRTPELAAAKAEGVTPKFTPMRGEGVGAAEYQSTKWIPFREEHTVKIPTGGDVGADLVFSLNYSDNGKYLAAASGDGTIRVFDQTGRFCWKFDNGGEERMPTTVCVWRPSSCPLKTGSVLVTGSVTGEIVHWHAPSKKPIYRMKEEDNQIYTISYRPDGTRFATAGKDYTIRVYDEETKALLLKLERGIHHNSGHSNRIFASKWKPDDENVIVTGGWDNNLMIWDVRIKTAARTIYGPHIAGNALDIQDETILTGSWRQKDALETWDLGTGRRLNVLNEGVGMIYTAKFTGDREGFVLAGGTGTNEARIYNMNDPHNKSAPLTLHTEKGIQRAGIYSSAICGQRLAIAGNSSQIRVYSF